MKRYLSICAILSIFLCLFILPSNNYIAKADEESLSLNTSYCILMEAKSKQILYQNNSKEKLYPASMTKMMGMLLVLEEIEKGKISWDDEITCSEYASSMGGTQIYLEVGEKMKLEDLFKSVSINSANDAIVCLGEYVAGSNEAFVKLMNKRAKELKMENTSFKNATGFDDPEHYTCPLDMGLLACELLKYDSLVLKYSSMQEAYIREDSQEPFWLVNTNKLLKYYEGMDGLKTGYTSKAGYNLTSTALRKGVRLVSVVMHEETIAKRSQDTIRLLDYGFSKYKSEKIFSKNDVIGKVKLNNSQVEEINVIVKEDIYVVLAKEENKDDLIIEMEININEPPIKEDDVIGVLKITTPSSSLYTFNLYSDKEVEKINFLRLFFDNLKSLFF